MADARFLLGFPSDKNPQNRTAINKMKNSFKMTTMFWSV